MNRQTSKLNALKVQRANTPGRLSDGGGLYLQISKWGTRSWLFRFMFNGKSREMGLGSVDLITLAEARAKALECRKQLLEGIDPIEARKSRRKQQALEAAKSITFDECAQAYIESHRSGWKNVKHADQWKTSIATYASPTIGGLSIQSIDTALVMRVLEPIWREKTETASRLRSRIELIISWATVRGFRTDDNPARWRGHLETLLPKRSSVQQVIHHSALPISQIGSFMSELRKQNGVAAKALEFMILTATRTGEVIGAQWTEIDFNESIWIIPPSRMKSKREHRVPLSPHSLEILKMMRKSSTGIHVFPGAKERAPLSNMAMLKLIQKRMNYRVTAHGFRSTFRDWAGERTNCPREVAEAALAHTIENKAEKAYARSDLILKRQLLMNEWARFCSMKSSQGGNLIEIVTRVA